MKTLKWVVTAAVLFGAIACCPCRKNKSVAMTPFTGTEWKLIQLYGENVTSDNNYLVTFENDGSVFGVGDCNRFSGQYTTKSQQLNIGENMAVTRMFCPNQQREDKFLNMMGEANAYHIDVTSLILTKNGETVAVFVPNVK